MNIYFEDGLMTFLRGNLLRVIVDLRGRPSAGIAS